MKPHQQITRRNILIGSLQLGAAGLLARTLVRSEPASALEEQPKDVWQIGCFTRPWAQYEYQVALDAIVEAGFKYVGLMTTKSGNGLVLSVETTLEQAHQIGEECQQRQLIIPSAYGGDIPVSISLQAGIEGLRKLIDCCVAAGIRNLMMGGVVDEKLHEPYYKAIAECCDEAASKGIGISVKPHGGTNSTGPQCRKIMEMVGKSNFRIWYDPGNIFYYSEGKLDPVDDAATVDGLVMGMSIKDFQLPKEVTLTPGTGIVKFAQVMERLKAGGFTSGPLLIECLAPGDLAQTLAEARKARLFVEGLVGQRG